MITMSDYNSDKDSITRECLDIKIALGNLKILASDNDLNLQRVAYYIEKRLEAIEGVFKAREKDIDDQISNMEKDYARDEYHRRYG